VASRPGPRWVALVASIPLLVGSLTVVGTASPAGAAGPTTWYVAAGGSGSSCTDTAPCGTVSAAVAQASPGDTVEVQGDVIGNVTVTSSQGTPAAPLTIEQWPSQTVGILDANPSGGTVLTVGSGAGVNLSGLTVANGKTTGNGGGIDNAGTLTVEGSTISRNSSSIANNGNGGGGMFNSGTATVTDSTISGNTETSAGGGGGIENAGGTLTVTDSTISGNSAADGGGIQNANYNLTTGTVTVTDSTISDNTAGKGGGIFDVSAVTTVEDSTIAGNGATATTDGGGGIYLLTSASATVEDSTISGNTASGGSSSIYNEGSTITLAGDILATGAPAGGECSGSKSQIFVDAGYNIDDDGTCGLSSASHSVSDSTTIDGYLGTLAQHGGPTETIALLAGAAPGANPAQAVIPSTFHLPTGEAACSQPDQRGVARAATCDMGAYALSTATLYATADTPVSGADCTTTVLACTLPTALGQVQPGATIQLVTPGTTAHYDGGYSVSTAGTSAGSPVTIEAAPGQGGPPVLDGIGTQQVLDVASNVYLDLSGVTIENGSTISGAGAGIYNTGTLTVAGSTILGGNAPAGGGIYNNATLTVTGSTISGNNAADGGGIYSTGALTVTNSTFSGNVGSINGGGIYDTGAVTVEDSTISGNTAPTAGGGIYLGQLSSATVAASTISGNTAGQGGGIYVDQTTVNLAGDILATAGGAPAGGECFGIQDPTFAMFFDAGYNIDDDGTCGLSSASHSVSDSSTIDASLGALASNGGPTKTVLPGAASPAARVIPPDTSVGLGGITLCAGNDQRGTGYPRPATGTNLCSIGAVEAPAGTAPGFTSSDATSFSVGTAGTFTVSSSAVPAASLGETGTLPAGVTFTNNGSGTATLAGTPDSGSAGSYPLTLTATNGVLPAASQSFTLTVDKATPTFSTTASGAVTYGGSVSDSATLGGGLDPTGTVSFALYGPVDPTCTGSPVYTDSAVSVTGDGSYPSGSFTPTAAGTYAWRASYSGDANNAAVTAACGTTGETVAIDQATPSTPIVANLPTGATYGGGFTAQVVTSGDGTTSVTSNSTSICTASGLVVSYVGVGTCSLTASVAAGTDYSGASGSAQTFTVAVAVPDPPTGAVAAASIGTTTITCTWTAPTDDGGSPITGYEVYRSTTRGQEGTLIAPVTTGSYTDTTAIPGTTYYYVVVAVTAGGTSAPSNEASATLPLAGPTGSSFAAAPGGDGYWIVHPDGGVFAYGTAGFYGSLPGLGISVRDIVGITGTPDGKGYWLVGADGGVFSFGDASFYGSMSGHPLNQPVVGIASIPDGRGYWLVAADGGIFSFGSAGFYGSTGGRHLNAPVVGMAPVPNGKGYWVVAADGGIFSFGSAGFYGSTGAVRLNRPVVGMAATPDGTGYWLVASDGGIFAFGQAGFFGSLGDIPQTSPVLGMAPLTGGGYQLIHSDGNATPFAG